LEGRPPLRSSATSLLNSVHAAVRLHDCADSGFRLL
jgi:hypothetical protein